MSKHYFYSLLKALAVVQILLCVFYSLKLTRELRNKTQAISQLNMASHVFNSNTWIANENVLQYSAILSSNDENNNLEIEVIAFFKETSWRVISESSQCVINLASSTVKKLIKAPSLVLRLEQTANFVIYKVVCVLEPREYFLYELRSQVSVAVINAQDFLNLNSTQLFGKLFFHRPKFVEKPTGGKRNATINCVHTLRGLDQKTYANILNWIEINKWMGVAKVRLYALDYDQSANLREIELKFSDFVEIVAHEVNITKICFNLHGQRGVFRPYEECMKKFAEYFKLTGKNRLNVLGLHEKLCTNDCFIHNKHVYQYLTNYDVDEFILPRRFQTNNHAALMSSGGVGCEGVLENAGGLKCSDGGGFKINAYIQRLISIYGKDVAGFRFENHLFLNNHEYLYDKIMVFRREQYLTYEKDKNTKLRYSIKNTADMAYLEELKKSYNLTRRLNRAYLDDRKEVNLNAKWKNYLTSLFKNRHGKTVFNTDFVDSINVHSASLIKRGKKEVFVSTDYGYVSHVRDVDIGNNKNEDWLSYTIQDLKVDLEYAFFIISNLNTGWPEKMQKICLKSIE